MQPLLPPDLLLLLLLQQLRVEPVPDPGEGREAGVGPLLGLAGHETNVLKIGKLKYSNLFEHYFYSHLVKGNCGGRDHPALPAAAVAVRQDADPSSSPASLLPVVEGAAGEREHADREFPSNIENKS